MSTLDAAHLPFGLPPIFPELSEQLEVYLNQPERFPIHNSEKAIRFCERTPEPKRLLSTDFSPLSTTLKVERNFTTGRVSGFSEVRLKDAGTTAKNSTSMRRKPGPPTESTRGSSINFPFWPGGFDPDDIALNAEVSLEEDDSGYLTCPPGFESGFNFGKQPANGDNDEMAEDVVVNLTSLMTISDTDDLGIWSNVDSSEASNGGGKIFANEADANTENDVGIDELVGDGNVSASVVTISESGASLRQGPRSTEWAELLDVSQPMPDFHQKVPNLAHNWSFELDTFQKQAIVCLESNQSVFISAHTSAGKTVVAEYAIALSQKHMTKTIYTSPIKALSNQKFRDFKERFEDVGLITGDIQINPAGTCLIMTTEILRSMLYNGSDTIRDLEYVIFDEVHYINDAERGVVWEEVLILLPDHVNIIMLSATVPNIVDFADWVGRTKRKKIFVISTLKRPVPLEHFLYTGSNGKTKDERFLLVDANGKLLEQGYKKAVQAKKDRESKGKQQTGAKGIRDRVGPQQEKNIWITLIDHLERQDKLPVVAFTLSRNRCDQNANLLTSLDLTTAVEKGDIHHFIQKCMQRLKGNDRKLPQVLNLTELLKRGIGIHHSGILPILKEVVELLFQKGWVKLLFATETFAMGVNMPARTVVFDNIRKHDGVNFRTLLPAEYIQMAGRAGRRGLDTTGTVIILCKNEVYHLHDLSQMMLGKPSALESKFRLTYSMILNLLRVEQLRVEDMMKRSFSEKDSQKKQSHYKERVGQLKVELNNFPIPKGSGQELEKFYKLAKEYFEIKDRIWSLLLSHPLAVKALVPGRLILLNHEDQINLVGMLLNVDTSGKEKTFTVLVLVDEARKSASAGPHDRKLFDYLSLAARGVGLQACISANHEIINVKDDSITDVITKVCRIDADKIVNDVKKRQIPRFKNDPPGPSTMSAVEDLKRFYNEMTSQNLSRPEVISWISEFKIHDLELVEQLQRIGVIRASVEPILATLFDVGDEQLRVDFERLHRYQLLKEELSNAEFLTSEASLTHLPEYHMRVQVLRQMNYIDDNKTVQLKGRVACEMGSHELLITELVFNNILTDRPVQEIVALLSCLVFQQRNCSAPELTEPLKKGIDEIKSHALNIGQTQVVCGMKEAAGDYVEQFNFGLVEVVYEWARGMPFSNITQLTDVQEGVIVRTIQRLDEVLRNVKDGARVIGDPVLYQKMDEASTLIKRDIVFAASLYTQ